MAEEFVIKSPAIEDKINQLLPSQGGFQPGVDFSASTMVVPIVDLTESAEGSVLRQDLQKAFSHGSITSFKVAGATTTLITTLKPILDANAVAPTGYTLYNNNEEIITDGSFNEETGLKVVDPQREARSQDTVFLKLTLNASATVLYLTSPIYSTLVMDEQDWLSKELVNHKH